MQITCGFVTMFMCAQKLLRFVNCYSSWLVPCATNALMMHAVTLVGFKYTTRFGGGSSDNSCSSRFDLHDIHERTCHAARFALHHSLHSSLVMLFMVVQQC